MGTAIIGVCHLQHSYAAYAGRSGPVGGDVPPAHRPRHRKPRQLLPDVSSACTTRSGARVSPGVAGNVRQENRLRSRRAFSKRVVSLVLRSTQEKLTAAFVSGIANATNRRI